MLDRINRYAQALAKEGFVGNFTLYVKPIDLHEANREYQGMLRFRGGDKSWPPPLNSPLTLPDVRGRVHATRRQGSGIGPDRRPQEAARSRDEEFGGAE